MKKDNLFLCILCLLMFGCRGQDRKVENIIPVSAFVPFEEKQKKDLLKQVPDTKLSLPNPNFNFRNAAKKVIPAVVHIKSTYAVEGYLNDYFWHRFFYGDTAKSQSDASGVIVSSDGFIVTNDHVVEGAESIEIILQDQRSYKAKVIGIDQDTDLALIKIDATNLPFIEFGNSDEIEVGDWVLAVGNPLNLTSTVTAGIVSAKARNINLIKGKGAVESYIQTDAAINQGNSGGALVDYEGKLVGINSAIATTTGAYAGYSFATPVNIVKKVINDLLAGGKVKRGYLGVILKNMSAAEAVKLNAELPTGIYIDSVLKGGAAMYADLKVRDILTEIDGYKIISTAQFQEILEQHNPGEKVSLKLFRNGKEKRVEVTLKEIETTVPKLIVAKAELYRALGIQLEPLSQKEKKRAKISEGLKVVEIFPGRIYSNTNIRKGFIITRVNGRVVNSEEEFVNELESKDGMLMIEGTYPKSSIIYYYAFGM